jgi:hypothetical protein
MSESVTIGVLSLVAAVILLWWVLGRVCLGAYLHSDKVAAPWVEKALCVLSGPWGWWLLLLFYLNANNDGE